MSFTVEKLEGSMAELTITVPAADFDAAIKEAYQKNKGRFQLNGFRKGKVPMAVVEKVYGTEVFFEDAANDLINKTYPEESENCELDITSRPEISVEQIGKGKDFIYKAKVAVKPEFTLGEYKGIEVEKQDVTVTDEEVDAEIKKAQKENGRKVEVTDRAAKLEDEVKIDFEGFVDAEAFEGGKGKDYSLTLGSHSFIDTFEDQIVGKNVGDEFDVNVTFPEDYQAENLKGKPAVFKVKLNKITETVLPELNDEFASDVSAFDTFEEYKLDTRKTLELRKKDAADRAKEAAVLNKLIEVTEIDVPEPMIELQQERILDDFDQRLRYQGVTLEQYLNMAKMDKNVMMEQVKPEAIQRIKSALIIEAVAKAEGVDASDEEVDAEVQKIADQYQLEIEKFKELAGEKEVEAIKEQVKNQKAIKILAENAKEVEAAKKEESDK